MTDAAKVKNRTREVQRVLVTVFLLNVVVSVCKIVIGTATDTASVRADGIHSIFDGCGNIAALIGISAASRPADEDHPYGHAKYEAAASLVIGMMLLVAAYNVGSEAIEALVTGGVGEADYSPVSLGVMVATLVVNICATTYEHRAGKRIGSSVLGADAKHTLSDVMVTVSVIVGLVFVRNGFPIADTIATLIVTVAIVATAVDVLRDVQQTFSDEARINSLDIRSCVMEVAGVEHCHKIRTRGLQTEVYVDLHVLVNPEMTMRGAHVVGNSVERHVKKAFPQVVEVMVRLEPADAAEFECPLVEAADSVEKYLRNNPYVYPVHKGERVQSS